jgi:hypothetical protein
MVKSICRVCLCSHKFRNQYRKQSSIYISNIAVQLQKHCGKMWEPYWVRVSKNLIAFSADAQRSSQSFQRLYGRAPVPTLFNPSNRYRAGTLISMLSYYYAIGAPHYPSMDFDMTVPHISDVGAFTLKPLFIAGSIVTTVFLDLAFLSERWLRHKGRLARNTSTKEKVLSGLSIAFAIIGTVGLICLSIFDSYRHGNVHNICLGLFMAGYIISAICLCWSYQILGMRKCLTSPPGTFKPQCEALTPRSGYREQHILRISFWLKLTFILVEFGLAIGKFLYLSFISSSRS